jgi:hypothetical protein
LQVGDTGPVESARRSNSRVLGSPFSGLSGQHLFSDDIFPGIKVVDTISKSKRLLLLSSYMVKN